MSFDFSTGLMGRAAKRALPLLGVTGTCVPVLLLTSVHADAVETNTPADDGDELKPITVNGVRSLFNDKLGGDLQDVPQSVTVISPALMAAQGITRLEDALKNVPGITLNAGEGAARGDTVNLRGFSAFNDFFLDGIRDAAVYNRDSFDLESVEVVKGPSATLFGRGSTGGAINQVSKAPTLTAFDILNAEVGTNHEYRATADLDVPFSSNAAFRLNAMGEHSDVADRDIVQNRRWGVAPTIAFGIGEADSLVIAYLHQYEDDIPDAGIPFVDGRPAPVPRDGFYGLASDRATSEVDIGTVRYKHEFSSYFTVSDTLRFAHYEFNYQDTMPNYGTAAPTPGEPLGAVLVGRDAPDSSGTETNLTNQTDLTARFVTGPISQTLFAGLEFSREMSEISRYANPFNADNTWVPETPLLDPDPYVARPTEPLTSQATTTAHSAAAYATDTFGLGQYVDLVAGVRFDHFSADYLSHTYTTGVNLELNHVDNVVSPRGALIVKPTPTQSYYFSYGTSFDPSAEALTLTTKTADLGPVRAKSFEVGAKNSWLNGSLATTAAIFHTEVDNAQTNDPDNPTITTLNGNERVEGIELGANGHLTQHLELVAGYTYLDGKTTESGTAAYVGKQMPNVARHAMNLWGEYELTDQWEIGTGGNWLGARYADSGETAHIPGYVVWNAMVSYRISKLVFLQLNVNNITNKLYYDNAYYTSVSENHIIQGAGRTAKLAARFNF